MMTPQQQAELLQVLASLPELNRLPPAADKAAERAAAVCPRCRQAFTWNTMQLNDSGFHLLCSSCAAQARQQAARQRPLAVFKMPGFYVACVVVLAALLWMGGAGRLDPAAIRQADRKREWTMQRYPRLLIERAGVAGRRAEYLADHDRPNEAERWATLAERSFREAADIWQGQSAEKDLLAAAARMHLVRGRKARAYAELKTQLARYPEDDRVIKTLHYYCGRLALQLGRKQTGKEHLETVLERIWERRQDFIMAAGELLGVGHAMADDPTGEMLRDAIIQAGKLRLPDGILLQESLNLLRKHKIRSSLAVKIEAKMAEAAGMPAADDEKDVQAPGSLTIEDLDDNQAEE